MLKISTVTAMLVTVVLLLSLSCIAKEKHIPGEPYYYAGFSGYHIPPRPSEKITREEALKRDAYYIAYFDEQERLILFTKYYKGRLLFSSKYYYRSSGTLERREMTDETGKMIIDYFDESGKIIK